MRLRDQVAVITGSSKGFGEAMAILFAQEGAKIVINYPDSTEEQNARRVKKQIEALNRDVISIQADVSSWDQVKNMMDKTIQTFGRIDILVNNAGINSYKMVDQIDLDQWNLTISVTLTGVFICTKCVLDQMVAQEKGNIINISSLAPWLGRGTIDYNAAKAGVLAITRTIARQYGRKGIRCNAIAPSIHKTPMGEKIMATTGVEYLDAIPLGFVPGPDSVAKAALFLASEESYYITGHTLVVDGGTTLR